MPDAPPIDADALLPVLERVYARVKEHCAEVTLPDDFTLLSVTRNR